jgi:hypothetical protein|tara:strand:- start:736 stop:1023 length:288 start_codon:yes stop_codon:yes gene_type:complete
MAKYRGKDVKLNKPFRLSTTESKRKKFGVYVKDKSTGRVKKVTFGARGMSIKKNNPVRQKSFLARMGGVLKEVKGQKTLSPAYWSIRAWKKNFPL